MFENIKSIKKTGRLLALDSSHKSFSVSSEILAKVSIELHDILRSPPGILGLEDISSPASFGLTKDYYFGAEDIYNKIKLMLNIKDKQRNNLFIKNHPHDVPGDWFKGPF